LNAMVMLTNYPGEVGPPAAALDSCDHAADDMAHQLRRRRLAAFEATLQHELEFTLGLRPQRGMERGPAPATVADQGGFRPAVLAPADLLGGAGQVFLRVCQHTFARLQSFLVGVAHVRFLPALRTRTSLPPDLVRGCAGCCERSAYERLAGSRER